MTSTWTDQAIALIKELWEDHSAGEIADKLGSAGHGYFTRNAVRGKLFRLGLTVKQKSKPHPQTAVNLVPRVRAPRAHQVGAEASKIANAIKRNQKRPELRPEFFVCQDVADIEPRHLSLLELEPNDCRWPTSNDLPHTFCALPKLAGCSYCPAHALINVGRGTRGERTAIQAARAVA